MLIDTMHGKMEEFIYGEYTHRFAVDMSQPVQQREYQRKVEMLDFEEYIRKHRCGIILL